MSNGEQSLNKALQTCQGVKDLAKQIRETPGFTGVHLKTVADSLDMLAAAMEVIADAMRKTPGRHTGGHEVSTDKKPRWWISWVQPTADYRPLTHPPTLEVLGWWCTGELADETAFTLVAAVEAESEDEAKEIIVKNWPEATEWRFCGQKSSTFVPNDRFVFREWMTERFGDYTQDDAK